MLSDCRFLSYFSLISTQPTYSLPSLLSDTSPCYQVHSHYSSEKLNRLSSLRLNCKALNKNNNNKTSSHLQILIPFKRVPKKHCPTSVAALTSIKPEVKLIPLFHSCSSTAKDHRSPLRTQNVFFYSIPIHGTSCPFHPVNTAVSFYPFG